MIEITIVPAANGRYRAVLNGRKLCTAKEPFFAAARILLAEGVDPETVIAMRHEGSAVRSLTMTVGKAAGLRVEENDDGFRVRRWKAQHFRSGSPPIEKNDETLPGQRAAE